MKAEDNNCTVDSSLEESSRLIVATNTHRGCGHEAKRTILPPLPRSFPF